MSGTFNVPLYGMTSWGDIFNDRQALALSTVVDEIRSAGTEIHNECERLIELKSCSGFTAKELSQAVLGYLAVFLDRLNRYSTNLCIYDVTCECVMQIFNQGQAIPMRWEYIEQNPFATAGASALTGIDRIRRCIESLSFNSEVEARLTAESATALRYEDGSFDAVISDPPYYNSVPYADLSDFFYVWLKRTVAEQFPDLFSTPLTPKTHEACEMAGWDSKRYAHKDAAYFEHQLGGSFQEMYRVLKPDGIAVVVYAHKTTVHARPTTGTSVSRTS